MTDPQNLGAIIRTAACVGAHGVIVPERRAVGLTPSAVKASAGAIETVKVARVTNLTRTLETLKKQGVWLYAADMDGEDYRKVSFSGPMALIVGAEGEGVSRLVLGHFRILRMRARRSDAALPEALQPRRQRLHAQMRRSYCNRNGALSPLR